MEPARRIEPVPRPYQGRVLPLPLGRHELGAQDSNLEALGSKRGGSASSPTAHCEPPPGADPGCCPYKRRPVAGPGGSVRLGGIRTRNYTHLKRARLPVAARARGADTRGRTGPSAVRRRSRKPCAAAWLPGLDSNQRGQTSEACWERHRPTRKRYAGRDLNPQTTHFECASFAG